MLIITTIYLSKWNKFIKILNIKKNIFYLTVTGILIFINWSVWIYAVSTNQIVDASFGYFIMPILSVLFGYLFFKTQLRHLAKSFYRSFEFASSPAYRLTQVSGIAIQFVKIEAR